MKLYFSLALLIIGNTVAMGQAQFKNLYVLVQKTNDKATYFTEIEKQEIHGFFSKTGEPDILICYKLLEVSTDDTFSGSQYSFSAQFIPDGTGKYKIMQTYGGGTHSSGLRESSPTNEAYFIGYSNDTTLVAVKAFSYIEEHTIVEPVYPETGVDRPAEYGSTRTHYGPKSDSKKEIISHTKEMLKLFKIPIDSISGSISFSYEIGKDGRLANFKVKGVKINKSEYVSGICVEINRTLYDIGWKPALRKGIAVAVKREMEISFGSKLVERLLYLLN